MRNTITLNGTESSTIPGLLIQSLAPISKPLMRTEIEEIDGRDGDIVTNLGFSAYDKEITIGLYGNYDINAIIAYFTSAGTVTFSNEPDKYYNYQIINQIDFQRLLRYRTATVTMHCQPFKYSTTQGADILSSSSNFATLNQSLNTDSSFYTYTSNVQADITATRVNSGTGGKFFAVFTIPVVQGVTYHLSGDTPSTVTMYAYTDTLRGTSAGISGKKLSVVNTYTATFTGTMVLGFYSSATTQVFIRNFFVTNEAGSTISGEGNNIVLEGTSEAPFTTLTAKGDTNQASNPTPDNPVSVQVVTGEQTVKITGKNLLNNAAYAATSNGITTTKNNDGSYTISGTTTDTWATTTQDFYRTLPAGNYTASLSKTLPFSVTLRIYDMETNTRHDYAINAGSTSRTISIDYEIKRAMWFVSSMLNNTTYDETFFIQFEEGTTATDIEPYKEQSYTISLGSTELCKIGDYQDYFYKNGDDWYLHKDIGKVIFDGTESWSYSGGNLTIARTSIGAKGATADLYSNVATANSNYGTNNNECYIGNNNVIFSKMVVNGSQISAAADWKTYLTSSPSAFYFPLATATNTKITDSSLIEQLDALSNAHSYKGRTHITATATGTNLPHIIEAATTGNMDGTVTNSGNTTARPKLTLFGSGNIGIYLNGVQLFQIALGTQGHITIDTNAMEAYQDTTENLMNRLVAGDYSNFVLNPGENQISFSGNATMCVVENYSRWI